MPITDYRTGNIIYSTDDLIGFARLGAFGQKSSVLLSALLKLKQLEIDQPKLLEEIDRLNEEIRKTYSVSGSIQEMTINQPEDKKQKKNK